MIFLIKRNIKKIRAEIQALSSRENISRRNGARILLYHSIGGVLDDHPLAIRVPVEEFEKEMEEIVNHDYKVILVREMIENKFDIGNGKYIAITFDDGYKDNFIQAAPILQKLSLKATFFITTSYIEGKIKKKWRNGTQREYMSWEEITALSKMGFEIGSHMVHHADLTLLKDNELYFEFKISKDIISEKIGKAIKVFSYPYGRVNKKVPEMAKTIGYIGGCSSFSGVNYPNSDPYILKRTEVIGCDKINDFRYKMYGFYD